MDDYYFQHRKSLQRKPSVFRSLYKNSFISQQQVIGCKSRQPIAFEKCSIFHNVLYFIMHLFWFLFPIKSFNGMNFGFPYLSVLPHHPIDIVNCCKRKSGEIQELKCEQKPEIKSEWRSKEIVLRVINAMQYHLHNNFCYMIILISGPIFMFGG